MVSLLPSLPFYDQHHGDAIALEIGLYTCATAGLVIVDVRTAVRPVIGVSFLGMSIS